jgi:DNA-binding FadR family transcriptional regulator
MGATATMLRPVAPAESTVDGVRSALIADIVAGELDGRLTAGVWRLLGTRYEASAAVLRLAAVELHELGFLAVDGSGLRVSGHDSWRLFAPEVFRELDGPAGRDAISAYLDARRFVDSDLASRAARRRSARDVVELSKVLRIISAVARGSQQPHVRLRSYRAADEQLRRAIARASRNRYLAEVSSQLRGRTPDAAWIARRALVCPQTASILASLIGAVRRGDAEQASQATLAEIDLIESWAWRRLSSSDRRR